MKYSFFAGGGTIDCFKPSFTHDEIISKIVAQNDQNSSDTCGLNKKDCTENSIDEAIEQIRQVIYKKEQEHPLIIRFFPVPNFEYLRMDIYAVAKIDNNHPTYVFGDDKDIVTALTPDAIEVYEL